MNIELERIVSEDEAECEAQRRILSKQIDDAIARIMADAERDVAARRARRERWLKDYAPRAEALLETGADMFVGIVRDRPRKKTF